MNVHIAILRPPYDRLVLDGRKTIECRLTRIACPPYGCVAPGERIYFKRSAGPFVAVAVARRVMERDRLTPPDIRALRRRYDRWICGAPNWWQGRLNCRYATLIWLGNVEPTDRHPAYRPQMMRAWYTLAETSDATGEPDGNGRAFEIELTAGAIGNRYVRISRVRRHFPRRCFGGPGRDPVGRPLTLRLADGPTIVTEIVSPAHRLRWRGWGPWFEQHRLRPGDRVRFIPAGAASFVVQPVRMT